MTGKRMDKFRHLYPFSAKKRLHFRSSYVIMFLYEILFTRTVSETATGYYTKKGNYFK